jgi:hypothetical protein
VGSTVAFVAFSASRFWHRATDLRSPCEEHIWQYRRLLNSGLHASERGTGRGNARAGPKTELDSKGYSFQKLAGTVRKSLRTSRIEFRH